MKLISAPIVSSKEIMPQTWLLWLEAPEIATEARPGQFVTIRCGERLLLRRPFAIHKVKTPNLALLFTVVGEGTRWLSNRKEGEPLDILGPLGNGFRLLPCFRRLLLVAGGIGIAPLAALAEKALANGYAVKLLLGAKTSAKIYPAELIPEKVELTLATEDGSAGEKGLITDLLPRFLDWAEQIFACGPIPMYRTLATMQLDDKPVQILLEQVMGCGVGVCRGCSVPTRHGLKSVCQDGPVFDLGEIIWEEIKEPVGRAKMVLTESV